MYKYYWWCCGSGYVELCLPESILSCYHQGACDDDCEAFLENIDLSSISDDNLQKTLAEISDWDLDDRHTNELRLIWCAAGDLYDQQYDTEYPLEVVESDVELDIHGNPKVIVKSVCVKCGKVMITKNHEVTGNMCAKCLKNRQEFQEFNAKFFAGRG